jgi:perosamine synthetase
MYAIVVQPSFGITRDQLAAILRTDGIDTRTFFCPMNQQPCLLSIPSFRPESCPVADRLWESGLYLPSSPSLPESAIQFIAESIRTAPERLHAGTC